MTDRPARERALRLLARREHSARELIDKLTRGGVPADEARGTVDALRREGLQSDERYAEIYVRSRAARGFGPFRLARELEQHGVEAGIIRRHLQDASYDWYALAEEAARRRFGSEGVADQRDRARRHRFLAQRGFEHDQIRQALERLERQG